MKQDFIRVNGPVPEFKISNYEACETTEVVFEDLTKGAAYTVIDYMDGSGLDTALSTHVYVKSTDKNIEKFYPTIYVGDDNGCVAEYRSAQPVILYANPTPEFELPDLEQLCVPFELEVNNTSSNIKSSEWRINQEIVSTNKDLNVLMEQYGPHEIQLSVTNKFGCTDSISELIEIQGTPEIDILMEDSICLYNTLNFNALITLDDFIDTTGMEIKWNFDMEGHPNNEITNKLDPQFAYFEPGQREVKMHITLNNGCKDSLVYPLDIRGLDDIDKPSIKYLSFAEGFELELIHEQSSDKHFASYQYNRSDGTTFINDNQTKSNFVDALLVQPDSVMCYDIAVQDHCGLTGATSSLHCFIYLAVSSNKSFKNELEWTQYIGWDKVVSYNIFRKISGSKDYVKIATVDGATTRYEDGGLCDNVYEYYVQAVNEKGEKSNSFRVMNRPEINENTLKSSIKNATVLKDGQISVSWNKSTFDHFDHYLLSKYESTTNRWVEEIELTDTFYRDEVVESAEYSYIYSVKEVDVCGQINEADRQGKTILLQAGYDNVLNKTSLSWSKYEEWDRGVDHYVVSLETLDGVKIIGTTTAADTQLIDEERHDTRDGNYCYIVQAIGVDGDTSTSNMVCVNGDPVAFIPTAFSPNGDGLNDQFRPTCRFIDHEAQLRTYSMEIYNRWGEVIYRSNNLIEGWDGNYDGVACPQGTYFYMIHYKGVNGFNYYHKGTVTLVK
ncbi:gliding motility-associated C-terminal domain-containing protein [bacterium]|nr:gliding motility-associated C-terminal domain-containing protein [bacterium]